MEPGLVQGFHDNTGHCSVVSIEMESCRKEEQGPGQAKGEKKMMMIMMMLMITMMMMIMMMMTMMMLMPLMLMMIVMMMEDK